MKRYWLLALVSAAVCASTLPAPAALNAPVNLKGQKQASHHRSNLAVLVHVSISHMPISAVTISCGAFAAGPPPQIGSRPLTHVAKAPTTMNGMVAMSIPIPPTAQLVACWPSTSGRAGLNEKRTTRMVSARFPIPLPPDPITMAPITVVGNGR
jgi:hypothetical protein